MRLQVALFIFFGFSFCQFVHGMDSSMEEQTSFRDINSTDLPDSIKLFVRRYNGLSDEERKIRFEKGLRTDIKTGMLSEIFRTTTQKQYNQMCQYMKIPMTSERR